MSEDRLVKKLASQWKNENRYKNFGSCLRQMRIQGIRGLDDLTININFPITAISGLNGTGKSTVGQVSVCAYRKPIGAKTYNRYYIVSFFPVSILDPKPFHDGARITYQFQTDTINSPQDVTVSRALKEWSGYKRQPERQCHYVGFTLYIPKVEQRDRTVYGAKDLVEGFKRPIDKETRDRVANILGVSYDEVAFQGVTHLKKEIEVGTVTRGGASYSESHMGFGEGRVLYMVDLLENSPTKSLFVLEEPETSLHEEAQHRLGRYLLDVCERRKHQIILSTHSSILLSSLPPDARKFLARRANKVEIYDGIAGSHARSLLSGGHHKALQICVEDAFAKLILQAMLLRGDKSLVKAVNITPVGAKQTVREAVRLLKNMEIAGIGIRDADVGDAPMEGLYTLPGTRPPEVELFKNEQVCNALESKFGVDFKSWFANHEAVDHHEWMEAMAKEAGVDAAYLEPVLAEIYVGSMDDTTIDTIVASIRQSLPNS